MVEGQVELANSSRTAMSFPRLELHAEAMEAIQHHLRAVRRGCTDEESTPQPLF